MDPLTDILSGMHIRGASFTRLDARAPWGIASSGEQAVKFVLVVRGSAVLTTASHPQPMALRGGDVFIMLDDQPYRIYDHESSQSIDCMEVEKSRVGHRIAIGGDGPVTSFVSGFFDLNQMEAAPLLKVLPTLIHLTLDKDRGLAFQSVLELLAAETETPGLGSEAVISRLFELLFVHSIRAYASQPEGPTHGWLAAARDRHLTHALQAMHGDPAQGWTIESLARVSGMSRSNFAARFKAVVGQTPLEYLTQWRMYCAARLLLQGMSQAEVAQRVGYESLPAFNRVFKRELAITPGAFRKARESAPGATSKRSSSPPEVPARVVPPRPAS